MKICLISFDFWHYDEHIVRKLNELDLEAHHINIGAFSHKHLGSKISNAFSKSPVEMKLAAIAQVSEGGSIDVSSQKLLKFNKNESVTMNPGGEVYSDPINFNLNRAL